MRPKRAMTSLIFGTSYLIHKGIVKHHRDKQRQKNYERWESLRDDYDEMKKVTVQQTGGGVADYYNSSDPLRRSSLPSAAPEKEIFTLRDQQEANDARLSWRPQEAWERSPRSSLQMGRSGEVGTVRRHKTGATWDEDMPEPLPVSRRSWDEGAESGTPRTTTTTPSSRRNSQLVEGSSTGRRRSSSSSESHHRPIERRNDEVEVVESPFEWWKQ